MTLEMLVLDTDHLVELDRGSDSGAVLQRKLEEANDEIATTIISAEEQFRGWLNQSTRHWDTDISTEARITAFSRSASVRI